MPEITPEVIKSHGLSMEEYERICQVLKRSPNHTELGIYSVMWSEHCSYKSSRAILKLFPTQAPWILLGPGENAGIIDIGDNLAVVMKIESHNHPSAVEPYQGAATGVGGIIRDIFTMGARPIALLDSLRFGELDDPQSRYLLNGVVAGIAGYGNCIGIPTVAGEIYFESCYKGNPLVNAMCVGLIDHDKIIKGIASGVGNPIIYVGSATGRDGLHGVTFASRELTEESYEDRPAVQVGDPFMEKLLVEACLELEKTGCIVGMQDMGGAGLTCSTCEMAARGNSGMELDLALVPRRAQGMLPYEVMLSESQERMLICVKAGTEDIARKIFEKWDLHAVVIGEVTVDGMLRVKDKGEIVAEIPAKSLADDAPVYQRPQQKPAYLETVHYLPDLPLPQDYNNVLLKLIASPSIGLKEKVYEQYDHMVQTNTQLLPGKGDAAILGIKGTQKAIAVTTDGNGRYCYLDPYLGGMIAVAEAARNVVCVGARPLAITNCLNFGNPEKPGVMWQFQKAVEGMSYACKIFQTPVTGGNVSFYNETEDMAIYPTPIVGMLGIIEGQRVEGMGFKDEGDMIVLLGETKEELGGSEYLKLIHGKVSGKPPQIDLDWEKKIQATCLEAIAQGIIKSAHDCSEGGLAVALAECCIVGEMGAEITFDSIFIEPHYLLFSESQSRIILTLEKKDLEKLEEIASFHKVTFSIIGRVKEGSLQINDWIDLRPSFLESHWKSWL
ncbi:MAG: phosphoribosylformylglycinamidine synthase subunit PurL [bacterium]|nr:phosphoribosylformylglycinamidine synthase subunit PurL [bacterium]